MASTMHRYSPFLLLFSLSSSPLLWLLIRPLQKVAGFGAVGFQTGIEADGGCCYIIIPWPFSDDLVFKTFAVF